MKIRVWYLGSIECSRSRRQIASGSDCQVTAGGFRIKEAPSLQKKERERRSLTHPIFSPVVLSPRPRTMPSSPFPFLLFCCKVARPQGLPGRRTRGRGGLPVDLFTGERPSAARPNKQDSLGNRHHWAQAHKDRNKEREGGDGKGISCHLQPRPSFPTGDRVLRLVSKNTAKRSGVLQGLHDDPPLMLKKCGTNKLPFSAKKFT